MPSGGTWLQGSYNETISIQPELLNPAAAGWIAQHRDLGHHPYPNPTSENPERWDCECHALWRILTPEQIRQKFAHLRNPG